MPFLRDKHEVDFIEGQRCQPFWGQTGRPFLKDKQDALFEGQTSRLYWGTKGWTFLMDKHQRLERPRSCPFWGIEEQTGKPFWRTKMSTFLRDKLVSLHECTKPSAQNWPARPTWMVGPVLLPGVHLRRVCLETQIWGCISWCVWSYQSVIFMVVYRSRYTSSFLI